MVATQQMYLRDGFSRFAFRHLGTSCQCGEFATTPTETVNIFEVVAELTALPDEATLDDVAEVIERQTPWLTSVGAWIRGKNNENVKLVITAVATAIASHYLDPSGISADQMEKILHEVHQQDAQAPRVNRETPPGR